MLVSAIITRCKTRWRDPTNAILSDQDWTDYINDTYAEVIGSNPFWPFTQSSSSSITIAANTRSAALPTNVFAVTAVYDITDQLPLEPIEGSDRPYRRWPDQTEQGVPQEYRLRGATIEVYPLPAVSTTFKIEFQTYPAELASSDTPPWPAQFHRLLVVGAMKRAYDDDGAPQLAAAYQANYDGLLQRMTEYVFGQGTSRYPGVVDSFYDN